MADNYIDQQETLGYGEFAIQQIKSRLVGKHPEFDDALHAVVKRLTKVTKGMETVLSKAGQLPVASFSKAKAAGHDPVEDARGHVTRLVKYLSSLENGDEIVGEVLGRETLTSIKKRRPTKLVHALDGVLRGLDKHQKALSADEYKSRRAAIATARDEIAALDAEVRNTRSDRRKMTPEVAQQRKRWLATYSAAKLIVEGVLDLEGSDEKMSDIFDDLAEVHRVAGVTDDSEEDGQPPPKADNDAPADKNATP